MVPRKLVNIQSTARALIFAIIVAYCVPSTAGAQNTNPASADPQAAGQAQTSPNASPSNAQSVEPTQPSADSTSQQNENQPPAEQKPVTTYPAPGATTQTSTPDAPQPKAQTKNQPESEPQGAATAEKVSTAGGAAAKPAGVAIAPAKQHQARSLLIKVGAVIAAGAAAGTVYALSRGTSSTPPGANGPSVVQKK